MACSYIIAASLSAVFCLSTCTRGQVPRHFITGYYPAWRIAERPQLLQPAHLIYRNYDILIYAFINLEADGSLSLIKPEQDKPLLLGPLRPDAPADYLSARDLGDPSHHQPGKRFSDYAHRHRTRFTVSIGGWVHSAHFSAVAADPKKRARFASACAQVIKLYHLDGVDIDWEYPGDPARNGSPADRQHFTALLSEVRDTLNALRNSLRRDLMLTVAIGAAPRHLAAIDWPRVHRLVNAVNLMSYSFYGQWDAVSNHNAPLFPSANATQPGYSCAEAVQALLQYGVPPAKINLGLAFYGRSYRTAGVAGLHVQTIGEPDTDRFARNGVTPLYFEIAAHLRQGAYAQYWDDTALVPYLVGVNTPSFVSFDDERSIALKAHYARLYGLRGVAIWDISGDYLVSADGHLSTPLVNAVRQIFSGAGPIPSALSPPRVFVFPAATYSGFVHLFVHHSSSNKRTAAFVLDGGGNVLHAVTFATLGHTLDMRALPSGSYRVRVQPDGGPTVETVVVKK